MLMLTGLVGLLVAGASIALLPDGSEGDADVETDDGAEDTQDIVPEGAGDLLDEITPDDTGAAPGPAAEADLRGQDEADLEDESDTVTTVPGLETPEAPDSPAPSAGCSTHRAVGDTGVDARRYRAGVAEKLLHRP